MLKNEFQKLNKERKNLEIKLDEYENNRKLDEKYNKSNG